MEKKLTYNITETWEREALAQLFGEEDIFRLRYDDDTDKEFDLVVEVRRVSHL